MHGTDPMLLIFFNTMWMNFTPSHYKYRGFFLFGFARCHLPHVAISKPNLIFSAFLACFNARRSWLLTFAYWSNRLLHFFYVFNCSIQRILPSLTILFMALIWFDLLLGLAMHTTWCRPIWSLLISFEQNLHFWYSRFFPIQKTLCRSVYLCCKLGGISIKYELQLFQFIFHENIEKFSWLED